MSRYQEDRQQNMGQKWKLPPNGQPISLFSGNVTATRTVIRPDDDSESLVAYFGPLTEFFPSF
jgi:Rap guanine nucleotide exchange factor 4